MNALNAVLEAVSPSIYIGSMMFEAATITLALVLLPHPLAVAYLALQVVLALLPLQYPGPAWAKRIFDHSMSSYARWCNLEVIYEAEDKTFTEDRPYIVGYEPHSILPCGLPAVFSPSAAIPTKLKRAFTLMTSTTLYIPLVRHIFYWNGGRAASRHVMEGLLARGDSVIVVPGGVAECVHMEYNKDVVFLKSRHGFVRMALKHGAPLVPVFCFGQNGAYICVRPGGRLMPQWLFDIIIRKLRFCPMLVFGYYGTFLPKKTKLTMIIGKPIEVPRVDNPSKEETQRYLDLFISRLAQLYDERKAAAGYPDSKLVVL